MKTPASFTVFFDADCPLCKREIEWLQKRIQRAQRLDQETIGFVDIASSDFSESLHGKSFDDLMAEIHGKQADGTWVIGVDVFRRLYRAAGFRRSVWLSRLPLVRHGLDLGYRVFARYRTRLTGRCKDGRCSLPVDSRESNG